jgi:hypothetical protein
MFQPRLTEMFGATTFIASLDCGGFHHKIAQACQQRFTQGKQHDTAYPSRPYFSDCGEQNHQREAWNYQGLGPSRND